MLEDSRHATIFRNTLKAKLKKKIKEMEKEGIIIQQTNPTDWISSLVTVKKPGKLRVCTDPRDLNGAIKRPNYQMPTVDKAKVFTVLDAKDGFYQVKPDTESSLLTTFWTPFGRYRYLRMPQGISSALEEYGKRAIQRLLECVNYLSRFIPTTSEVSAPLRNLSEKNALFLWESQQEEAFQSIKSMISSTPVLKYYDVTNETTI